MKKIVNSFLLSLVITLISIGPAEAFRYVNPDLGTDLMINGFGIWQGRNTNINGDESSVRHGNPLLSPDYSQDFKFNLATNGTGFLWNDYKLTGKVRYNSQYQGEKENTDVRLLAKPEDNDNLELFLKLEHKNSYLFLGDQALGFTGTEFSLYNQSLFCLKAYNEGDRHTLTAIGAQAKGASAYIEIPADGTSGPYYLSHAPILRGTEVVKTEVRDILDTANLVIESYTKRRGVDYSIDYEEGKIVFFRPLRSETLEGDLQIITVSYQYLPSRTGYRRYIGGLRGTTQVNEHINIGATYLTKFDDSNSWRGRKVKTDPFKHQVYGLDLGYSMGEAVNISAEFAKSENRDIEKAQAEPAWRADSAFKIEAASKITGRANLSGSYRRVEENFNPMDRPSLGSDQNKETYKFAANYALTDHQNLAASYDLWLPIISKDGSPLLRHRLMAVSWSENLPSWPAMSAKYEVRDVYDAGRENTDNRKNVGTIDIRHTFSHLFLIGNVGTNLNYQYTETEDSLSTGPSGVRSHQGAVSLSLAPFKWLSGSIGQRYKITRNKATGERTKESSFVFGGNANGDANFTTDSTTGKVGAAVDEKGDGNANADAAFNTESGSGQVGVGVDEKGNAKGEAALAFGTEIKINEQLKALLAYEHKSQATLSLDGMAGKLQSTTNVGSIGLTYSPYSYLSMFTKYELGETRKYNPKGITSRTQSLDVEAKYSPTRDLSLTLSGKLEELRDVNKFSDGLQHYSDEVSLRANYNLSTDLAFFGGYTLGEVVEYAAPKIKTKSERRWLGVKYDINNRWDVMARYRAALLGVEYVGHKVSNGQHTVTTELGYELGRYSKMVLGYEHIQYKDDDEADEDYKLHEGYLKLLGKF